MGRSLTKHRMTGGTRTADHTPDGRPVLARQYNVESPHPHPRQNGRHVPTTGLNLVMLDDETTLYECDECGWLGEKSLSVISHMTAHSGTKTDPDYPLYVLRQLVQTVSKYKDSRVRGYAEKTATELNDLGVPTRSGEPWTPHGVSHLYSRWKNDLRVKSRRTAKKAPTSVNFTTEVAPRHVVGDPLQVLADALDQLLTSVNAVREAVDAVTLGKHVDPAELAELRAKAQRWDDLRASLR